MKVYTHFYPINGQDGFRWRTLLQFGESWDCIGSIVMKNPGSSNFKSKDPISDKILQEHLKTFDNTNDDWYEFNTDSTMNCVADMFAYYYNLDSRNQLNGVIQIFNLFYIKEANLHEALRKDNVGLSRFSSEEDMVDYDIDKLVEPIYLGFSDLAWHRKYTERAQKFFKAALYEHDMAYLYSKFEENTFLHPQYLMLFGKYKANSIKLRLQFKQNTTVPLGLDDALQNANFSLTKNDCLKITEEINRWLFESGWVIYDNKRYKLCHDLGVSIVVEKNMGYVSYRHIDFKAGYDKHDYQNSKDYVNVLKDFAVNTDRNEIGNSWLGRKSFTEYGHTIEDIIQAIKDELVNIKGTLEKYMELHM